MARKIFVSAGEPSGDLHASRLVKEIKILDPSVVFMGMGGANMASEGVRLFIRTDEVAIVGFDFLLSLKKIKDIFDTFLANVEKERPDLVILLDYPGFNLRLAKALKKRGIKVVYYISPQLWAWGKNRIYTVKKYVDKMLVFFPFEGELYKKYGIPVEVVGHPLLDIARPAADQKTIRERLRFDAEKKTIILLPGSREREVASLMPIMTTAILELYKKHKNIQVIVVRASNLPQERLDQYLKTIDIPYRVIENKGTEIYGYLSVSDLAIVASGTATLECGIMNVPMIITYKVSMFNAAIFKLFINVPYVGLVNILAGKEIVPELLQFDATSDKIYAEAEKILFDGKRSAEIKKELLKVRESLGREGASRRAAEAVMRLLNRDYGEV
ncbi:MAG: lipid-A-disaccharide synthase [Candidatus Omnitrophota bacterium]|nr:lipid-A-disaccharide synthase [Candidatus Omnitrophota bacterium]